MLVYVPHTHSHSTSMEVCGQTPAAHTSGFTHSL